jgi:hypothetical protein
MLASRCANLFAKSSRPPKLDLILSMILQHRFLPQKKDAPDRSDGIARNFAGKISRARSRRTGQFNSRRVRHAQNRRDARPHVPPSLLAIADEVIE